MIISTGKVAFDGFVFLRCRLPTLPFFQFEAIGKGCNSPAYSGGMRFLGLDFEALKLDFLDDGRDIGLFRRKINLLDGSFDNGIHFARESALAPIRALLPEEDRKALGALVVFYPSIYRRRMFAQCSSNLADLCKRSSSVTDLEERLEYVESPHGCLPSFFGHGHQVRCPGVAIARSQIRYCLVDWDTLKPTLPYFPGDNGVHTGVVDNYEPPLPPADCTSWNEPERDGHATFPVSCWRAKCIPMITNSLSFANSELTFSNNLRLNTSLKKVSSAERTIGLADGSFAVKSHIRTVLSMRPSPPTHLQQLPGAYHPS